MAFEGVGSSVLADTAIISACCLNQGHIEANTGLEKEEVVNSAHTHIRWKADPFNLKGAS